MYGNDDGATIAQAWLARLMASDGAALETLPHFPGSIVPALAALVAEAIARNRRLLLVTADDAALAEISNAIDLNLRPLCLVLPAAAQISSIALRATLSLLKSRLARASDDTTVPAWQQQRQRLTEHAALWEQCLAWSQRGLDNEPWPEDIDALFPACIMPFALAGPLAVAADWVVLIEPQRLPEDALRPWPGAQRTLRLGGAREQNWLTANDPTVRQRAELELLTQELAELELELATAQAEIADFTRRYHQLIGTRMATLDELTAELARRRAALVPDDIEAQLAADDAQAHFAQTQREQERFEQLASEEAKAFRPSGDIKKLFRQLAQKIHPDRATGEADRAWRTQLMSEANRAYQAGDEGALLEVLALWQENAAQRASREVDLDVLSVQLLRLRKRVAEIEAELNKLFGSRLYELFTATNIARRTKRDLLQEMADRLDADIGRTRSQLAAAS